MTARDSVWAQLDERTVAADVAAVSGIAFTARMSGRAE